MVNRHVLGLHLLNIQSLSVDRHALCSQWSTIRHQMELAIIVHCNLSLER